MHARAGIRSLQDRWDAYRPTSTISTIIISHIPKDVERYTSDNATSIARNTSERFTGSIVTMIQTF
jgi:hypothetical protein